MYLHNDVYIYIHTYMYTCERDLRWAFLELREVRPAASAKGAPRPLPPGLRMKSAAATAPATPELFLAGGSTCMTMNIHMNIYVFVYLFVHA